MNTRILQAARAGENGWYFTVAHKHGQTYGLALRRAPSWALREVQFPPVRPKVVKRIKREVNRRLVAAAGALGFLSAMLVSIGGGA